MNSGYAIQMTEARPQPVKRSSGDNIPAAAYVRMSTEHQRYSINNQLDAIHRYASENKMEIVKTYADSGKSGLKLEQRDGLQRLLSDVEARTNLFQAILVFDISRWGRFQDADESAFYEFWCRRAGYLVHYCGEQFENDGSPLASIVKSIKRAMAAEYSRELSRKVFAGQRRIVQTGFKMGGAPGYGLRRFLVDGYGNPKEPLSPGVHKSIQTDRVILVPGPREEVEIVNQIYRWFLYDRLEFKEIVQLLNVRQIANHLQCGWTHRSVRAILTNEKYIGSNVFNRTSRKLGGGAVVNDRKDWIIQEGAFEPIVDPDLFWAVQREIRRRNPRYTDNELLEKLAALLEKHGFLTNKLIDASDEMPHSQTYVKRFGDITRAYDMIGYSGVRDMTNITRDREIRNRQRRISEDLIERLCDAGALWIPTGTSNRVCFDGEITIDVKVARRYTKGDCPPHWFLRREANNPADISVCVRLDLLNNKVKDFHLLPSFLFHERVLKTDETNGFELDVFRSPSLHLFSKLGQRHPIDRTKWPAINAGVNSKAMKHWSDVEQSANTRSGLVLPRKSNSNSKRTKNIIRRYRTAVDSQRRIVQNAQITHARLSMIESVLKLLLSDEHFRTLLRAEGLDTMPQMLFDHMVEQEAANDLDAGT